ncbi:MAG: carboxypeptidase-like regulatory domain-containing protein [Acidobacteriota bacterium]
MPTPSPVGKIQRVILTLALVLPILPVSFPVSAQTTSGTLEGKVQNQTGKPMPDSEVAIVNERNGASRKVRTNDKGTYTATYLPTGNYRITASSPGFKSGILRNFAVNLNKVNHIRPPKITLLTATLKGTVVDPTGNAVSGARVIIVDDREKLTHETVTNQDGSYIISDLLLGNYSLTVLWADGQREMAAMSRIGLSEQTMDSEVVAVVSSRSSADSGSQWLAAQSPRRGRTKRTQHSQLRLVSLSQTSAIRKVTPIILTQMTVVPLQATGQPPNTVTQTTSTTTQAYQDDSNAALLVNTTDAARSSNFSERQINSLPVGGATAMRSFDEFALLIPGVAPPPYTPGVRGPGVGYGIGTAGQFSVNGMRARANNFSVDGSDNNDPDVGVRRQGFVALVPQSIESVKEISISTLLWDAELGRNFGGQVNAVSKYGGNEYHGQLYSFLTDSSLNAKNFFDTGGKTPFTRTQTGLTFGGPIVHDRTHFFSSFEHDQTRASTTQHFSTPTDGERSLFGKNEPFLTQNPILPVGVAVATCPIGCFPNDPLNINPNFPIGPFPGGVTPLGERVLSTFYPIPDNPAGPYGANTFTQILPADGTGNIFSFRLTHQLRTNSSLNVRYNFTNDQRILPSVNRALSSTLDSHTRSNNLSIIFDSALGPALFSQARFSFGRTQLNFSEYPGSPFIFSSSLSGTVRAGAIDVPRIAQTGPIGELRVEPYSPVGVDVFTFPQQRASNTFQFADSISWLTGNHLVKFGGDIRHYQLNSLQDRLYRPQAVYGGALLIRPGVAPEPISGVRLASLGVASSVFQTVTSGPPNSTVDLRFTEFRVFINDNWKVHPRFNIDFGLRYELNTVPRDVNNRIEDALRLEGLPVAGTARFDTPNRVFRYNAAVNAFREILDGRSRIYDPDRNNFSPHAGFAWTLDDQRRTTLRAGYGIYFDTILGAVVSQSRNVFPNEIPIDVDPNFLGFDVVNLNNPIFLAFTLDRLNNLVAPVRLFASSSCNQFGSCNQLGGGREDFAAFVSQLFIQNRNGGLSFTLPEKNLRTPYAQQWHLTFEREILDSYLFSAAYVGTKGTKLIRLTTPNLGPIVTPQIPVSQFQGSRLLNTRQTQTGFIRILPNGQTCNTGGGTQAGPPGTDFCVEADDRPNPFLGSYQIFGSSANSSYHALQLEVRKRYNRNFQFTAAYTWSHAIDDVSDLFPIAGAPTVAQDSSNLRAERASANFDIRHRFAASLLWDLPFYRNSRGVAGKLLGQWQIASIFQAHTGQPFTLNVPFDANLDGNLSDRPSTTDGLVFFNGDGPRRVGLAPGRSFTDFFVLEKNGVVGRNTLRGDSFINLDLSISKTIKLEETKDLQFRVEFFNLFNRANFGLPIRTIGAPGFGSAVDTVVPSRTVVLVFKSSF